MTESYNQKTQLRRSKAALYSISFISGFALMGYEILGVRVLTPYYGSSVFVWGAIISVILAGLSIGYAVGGRIADHRSNGQRTLSYIILFPALLITFFPLYGYRICRFAYAFELDSRLGALLLSLILFLTPCIFIGCITPSLVKKLAEQTGEIGTSAGNIYSISTFGSISGTLFTSFYLISLASTSKAIVVMGLLLFICWLISLAPRK